MIDTSLDIWTDDDLDVGDGGQTTITQGGDAYLINDRHYDRITTVLNIIAKPGLEKWKRKVGFVKADEIMRESAILGKEVHAICEEVNKGRDPINGFWLAEGGKQPRWVEVRGTRLQSYYDGYTDWYERNIRQVVLVERTTWSDEHGYAGTPDTYAELKGKFAGALALLDNKTSKYLSWVYRLQTAAYKYALLERRQVPAVDKRGIVFLSSKTPGTCTLVDYDESEYEDELFGFLSALFNYRMAERYDDDWKRRG